jgi:hypothetical protein
MKPEFPRLKEMGVPVHVHQDGQHVWGADIHAKLTKEERKTFNKLFGVQTCPVIDGRPALFPWDAEAVLERMKSGRLTGTQLMMD